MAQFQHHSIPFISKSNRKWIFHEQRACIRIKYDESIKNFMCINHKAQRPDWLLSVSSVPKLLIFTFVETLFQLTESSSARHSPWFNWVDWWDSICHGFFVSDGRVYDTSSCTNCLADAYYRLVWLDFFIELLDMASFFHFGLALRHFSYILRSRRVSLVFHETAQIGWYLQIDSNVTSWVLHFYTDPVITYILHQEPLAKTKRLN